MEFDLKKLLPTKIFDVIERAGLATHKQILTLSVWDVKKLTNLHIEDIHLLKNIVSEFISPKSFNCKELLQTENCVKVTTGFREINEILRGGFSRGTLTEIFGESGSGKTQLAIQACLHNNPDCSVYICTEDVFPIKRFEEMKQGMQNFNTNVDYGKNLFVEHITEAKDLLCCVRVRLPKLLTQRKCSLIVLDSIAAPFRVESTNYVQRAEELRELAMCLINIAQQFNLAVVCINQVTASFDGIVNVLPCLGLAWSNMISTRLWMKKLCFYDGTYNNAQVRNLSVVFATDLPNHSVNFIITTYGLKAVVQ
ncbi:hypothetical protein K1T71_010730 [Dendrolimus kikuchii]|uniref:Uncharacterized protein n=1 Tax=Dendrolimus kikuchii TaxID=765133 RepID=A0ACC1CPR9_9NEOP|nr:hypothetical protein K1T71_010730 [Dendrolimus kikuchii]